MQNVKEKAANVAASAKSGMEKTKATVQEKVERMTAHNPAEKELATEKKEERINQAEFNKQVAREHNSATKQANTHTAGAPYTYSTTGQLGHSTGTHQMSALPGHGTGQPAGQTVEGVVHSHPTGTATGTTRPSDTLVGQATNQGYGTGGTL